MAEHSNPENLIPGITTMSGPAWERDIPATYMMSRPSSLFTMMAGDKHILTLSRDGVVTLGEGIAPEHAAHEFYQVLLRMRPQ